MYRLRRANKLFAVFTSILMLAQSFFPIFPLITPQVFAQEVTPTETQTPTPEPTTEQTSPTPTEEIQPTPTEEATPTPTTETTPSVTPEATPTVAPTDTVTPTPGEQNQAPQQSSNEPPKETGPPEQGQILDGASTEATPSPTVTPEQPEEGVLHASVLQNVEAASLDLDNIDPSNSATLSTDKADYAPTDTAIITGTDFTPGETYNLTISSDDPPPTSTTVQVTADENGVFVYAYQLDGIYRPNYKVEAKELDGTTVDVVTFTDSDTTFKSPSAVDGNHDEWSNATNAFSSDDQYATENSEDDEQSFENFGFSIPAGSTINGIELRLEAKSSDTSGCQLEVRMWSQSDNEHTDYKTQALTGSDTIFTLGSASDLWGSTWIATDFSNSNFHAEVRFDDVSSSSCDSSTVSLDHIQAKVHYTEPAPQPDLTATKTNNVGGNAVINTPFTWTIRVENIGLGTASFTNNQNILWDERASTGVSSYGTPTITTNGTTGSFDCTLSGTNNRDLVCEANGAATMPPGSYIDVAYTVTPSAAGTLNNPRSGESCLADDGGVITESSENNNSCANSVTVASYSVVQNPPLGQACGLDIALILDNSTSIDSSELSTMKSAMTAFTAAFAGTPTQFSVSRFATTAQVLQNFTANITDVNSAINGISVAGGYTNWEDGLLKGQSTLPNRTNPDLVVFASDGNPNRVDNGTDVNESQAVSEAALVANSIKTNGARILALGIGNDLDTANLQAISGPNVNTGLTSDVITSNFATLADDLAEYAIQLCGGTITAQKFIDDDGDLQTTNDRTAASGWTFDVNGSPSNPAPVQTDAQGFTPAIDIEAGTYSITETPQSGYALLSASCTKANQSIGSSVTNGVGSMAVGANDIVSCTFINTTNVDLPSYICHATGAENHWVKNYPATLGQLQGHVGISHQNGDDIIPPVAVFLPLGQNWDAEGQAIWANNCAIPPKEGSVKVNKLLDSDGNGSFETTNPAAFTWSLDDVGSNAMGSTVNNVTLGAHNVNENTVTNYHLVGWFPGGVNSTQYSCTNLPQGNTTLPAAITVAADQTTEITICNALDTGSITVRKMVDRDGNGTYDETNPADFTWTLDGAGPYAMGYSHTTVPVGSHNINENSPSDYHFVGWFPTGQQGWSCTNLPTDTQNTNFHQLPIPVNVGSGGTSDYTICNARDTGTVTITKEVIGGTALPSDWDFSISSVAGTFKSGNSVTLPTGSYTVTESGPADYSATGVTGICSGLQGGTATMTVTENGGTCTFTNTRDTGSLKVNKRTDGNGDGDYNDSGEGVNGSDSNGFTWSIDGSGTNAIGSTVAGVTTGNHDIGENTVAGYHFVGWFTTSSTRYSCTNPEGTTLPVSVAVAKNTTAEITLCNARDTGSITIIKNAIPNSDQNFSFDVSSGFPGGDFELEDDGNDNNGGTEESKTVTVTTGQYWVEEDGETGWHLTSLVCNDQNGTVNIASGRATLNVETGEAITCTFTNEKLGTLIIKKDATPNSDENFRFTRSFGGSFELEDDGNDNNGGTDETRTFENLTPGTYTVTEDAEPGWTLSDIVCSDQTVPNVQGRSVTVDVGYNETVTCTFKNTELGKIRGYKFNDTNGNGNRDTGEAYLNGWTIFIDANDNGVYDDGELTQTTSGQFWFFGWNDEGEYEFENLLPGTYSVCEVPQTNWTNSTPLCQSTTLTAGDTDSVYFGNHEPLTLRAYKIVCENESDLPNWGDDDAPNITATTAQNFVDNSEGACRFEEGWDFQWGYDGEVVKYGNGDQLGAAPSPWQTLGTTNASGYTEAAITSIDEDDDLWVREVLRANYVPFSYPPAAPTENDYSAEIYCHRDGQNYDNFDRVDNVRFGETYYCVAFNALNSGDIIVTKYNDDNGNGTQDDGEETLPGWDMNVQSVGDDIYNATQTTGQDGTTTFEDVTVGTYVLTETLKEGWRQTELSCSDEIKQEERFVDDTADDVEEDDNGRFTLNGGQTVRCKVGNQFVNPDLTITKSNDTAGGDRSPGGNVTFTLTVTATDSAVLDVVVKDLPAGGFTYRPGSWTAVSNVRGDLKALLVTTEPTYASPGTWNLGDMQEGEIVTLTYIADISNDEQPGLYRDLAWAQGKDLLANKVVANDTNSPQYFVGTEVNVVKNDQSGASVNVKQEVLGAVLGASTELPATGANSIWFIIAAIFMSLGSVTALAGWVLRRKYA